MMAQPAPSSSPFTYKYDVFLSFRGVDTRNGFTGNLYNALRHRGVLTFIDDRDLKKGEEITPSLLHAIQKSWMAIVIFSKNYASSTFCLSELVEILECYAKDKMWILPVFYDIEPSEVRYQLMESYKEAFAKHEGGRFKNDKETVKKWRSALNQASKLSGFPFKHGDTKYEHVFIREIIEEVSRRLKRPALLVANYPVGLETRMKDIHYLIDVKFKNEVNMLGIHGIGGIGKSVIARAVYNLIAHQFEGSCFLANVREKSTKHGLEKLQETMLDELTEERNIKLGDVNRGIVILKARLHRKKVLLILDDVDKKEQLQATAGGVDWFGSGSIIFITTRNKHLLDCHDVKTQYEVDQLNDTEALELFRWNAFKSKDIEPSYMNIVKRAVDYAGGLPLALETIGSNLFGKTLDEWKSAVEEYERIPNRDVQKILEVSYDGLGENEKEIFLDIACFFVGCSVRYVTNMLDARGFNPKYGVRVLEEKSLIKVWRYNGEFIVTMHDLIQRMGREIVRQQSNSSEKRNRLWLHDDVIRVMKKNKENDKIEAMTLDIPEDKEFQWNQGVFGKMDNLMMLIRKNVCFFRSFNNLPDSLRVLEWWRCHAASSPSILHSRNLVILNLSYSHFKWEKQLESEVLSQLILTGCQHIKQIPDVSGLPNLTELCVDDCTNLIGIDNSVGCLDKLLRFSAKGCIKLGKVPALRLTSLIYLCLRGCCSLEMFPEILGPMEKLEFVDLEGTGIKNLTDSMQNLEGVKRLYLNRCKKIESNALSEIIERLPNWFPSLETLTLQDSNLTILPARIEECRLLKWLDLSNSKQLEEIKGLPPKIVRLLANNCTSLKANCSTLDKLIQSRVTGSSLQFCVFPAKSIPGWFEHENQGDSLYFWFHNDIPSIIVCAVLGVCDDTEPPFSIYLNFSFKINGINIPFFYYKHNLETDHILMFNYIMNPTDLYRGGILSKNEWNCGKVSFEIQPNSGRLGSIKCIGVHVNGEMTGTEDLRFTNPCPPNRDRQEQEPTWTTDGSNDIDGAFLDNQAKDPGQSFQAPVFAETQNIQVQSPTSTSGKVRPGLHLGTCSTKLPKTSEASLRNPTELARDAEIEAFYASLDNETRVVSCSHDKSATGAPSEETMEALRIVQDFISNDASNPFHPERCSAIKTSLEHLSNLSAHEGISREKRKLISEASKEFTHWSKDYIEASMKIESTASELQRADELETGLEDNKKKFREVVALENELLDKLACLEKSKRELEEQINIIEAKISSQSEKNILTLKRDIFEEGKTLKIQRDMLREKAPRLKHEHDLAKKTQTRINSEWSELREKFKKIAEE